MRSEFVDLALLDSMIKRAEEAVFDAKAGYGIDLDYTLDSIQGVEAILSDMYALKRRGLVA